MAFGSEQWMYSAGGFYPDEIGQSLRFNVDDSAYLARTPSSAGNRKTWTYSTWVKRSVLSSGASPTFGITAKEVGTNSRSEMEFANDEIEISFNPSGSQGFTSSTNAVFRDTSAWYHIVVSVDMTQATATDRLKVYVNGVSQTFRVYSVPSQNTDCTINNNVPHSIGRYQSGGNQYFGGYLAEVNFVDGQALDPTDFGVTKSGVWIPKSYSGTYGTNGFYLDFGNSGSLGADVSGNGNNWTPTNLASTDQMLDSPTNNWATLNPLDHNSDGVSTLSEGNLKTSNAASFGHSRSTIGTPPTGKYYAEVYAVSITGGETTVVGLYTLNGKTVDWYSNDGTVRYDAGSGYSVQETISTFSSGDILAVSYDADTNTVGLYKNGTLLTSFSDAIIDSSFLLFCQPYNATAVLNFGQDSSFAGTKTAQGNTDANGIGDFYYAPPADHLALCSANLPETAIDPNRDDIPADYFNPALYTGNGSTQSITGVGFRPDWVWTKGRSNSRIHSLLDVVRGANKYLSTNDDLAEVTPANNNRITTIDADGFSLGNSTNVNASSETYVAWNWKAGGTAVANTDGTLASQVSANTKAGFSIVSYTGNGTEYPTVATVGHGLNQDPEMIIVKDRDTASTNWCVYNQTLALDQALLLNDAGVAQSFSNAFGRADPTSTVFTVGQATGGSRTNDTGTYIAYCFHSVEGFSKFGSYTGNGSTDGPFVYTGFRPAYVMIKKTSGTGNWLVYDNKRGAYNLNGSYLYANTASVESTSSTVGYDFLSNGFKTRNTYNDGNVSGETYIYMAFAEMPFKYANAR